MSVYDKTGTSLSAVYDKTGTALSSAYDKNGTVVFTSSDAPDYDHYDNEYQHKILQARDLWKTEYRADSDIVPLVLTTDQHGYLNTTYGKPLYDYLALAMKWTEISASLNLGDVCAGKYNTTDLGNMLTALSGIPSAKKINMMGNHDVWYGDFVIDNSTFTTAQSTYFNNSSYNGNVRFENRGNEIMIDTAHNIKYVCVACWYYDDDVYYHYTYPEDAMDWLLTQLSANDGYDIVILSHIQPLATSRTWYTPAVDGGSASSEQKARNYSSVAPYGATGMFEGLLSARKNKTSGTVTDSDGVTHSYNFSNCTTDILCWLAGHEHLDSYAYDGGDVPVILFDAYRYDNQPFYLFNIDRTRERVNVWKIDDSPTYYNYQVPFTEPS